MKILEKYITVSVNDDYRIAISEYKIKDNKSVQIDV